MFKFFQECKKCQTVPDILSSLFQTLDSRLSEYVLCRKDLKYSTVQYSTVQYSTVQYSTVQYSTVQYSSSTST